MKSRFKHPWLLLIILIGFALRLYGLGAQSLWYDETVSAYLASQSVPDLVAHTARDIHPPGYYLILHYWRSLIGDSEFALAYFSLVFGVLLIALTYKLSRLLTHQATVGVWAALLVAISPYNLWYSQEVRMYTFGAFLGGAVLWATWRVQEKSTVRPLLYWAGYILIAAIGMYVLYYFAFLLITLNLFFIIRALWPNPNWITVRNLIFANGLAALLYTPWIPIAWRQATNPPVPPWRSAISLWDVLLESWSALSFGQSVEPTTIWPLLLLTTTLFILGLGYTQYKKQTDTTLLLALYTLGPFYLIQLFSLITPLYHVRYIFTYSPLFYIALACGLAWLTQHLHQAVGSLAGGLILLGSIFSIVELHTNPRYQADDFRAAVDYIEAQWKPGDMILTNAGYTYTAFLYYTDFPNIQRQRLIPHEAYEKSTPLLLQSGTVDGPDTLGWGDPRSDFYGMSKDEATTALQQLSQQHHRLWMLRAYDTVTDPQGYLRMWFAENTTMLEDQPFSGESNIRVQGFLLEKSPELAGEAVDFEDGVTLTGWQMPTQIWQAGQSVPIQLGWQARNDISVDYKLSLKLWSETGELAAQGEDTWPGGTLHRATNWASGDPIYHPDHLTLPPDLPPGRYWLNVELYHPDTAQPLPRLDGTDPVVTLGLVEVGE